MLSDQWPVGRDPEQTTDHWLLTTQIKSALNFAAQDAWQPSPRTAKPRLHPSVGLCWCKRHFRNRETRRAISDGGTSSLMQ